MSITVSQEKSSVLWAIFIDSGSWRLIKQSLMRRFFVSRQESIFWPFEVSAFSYFVIIFQFVMVSMKILEIHTVCWSYQGKQLSFFPEFFIHIYTQKSGSKCQKTWFRNFSSWKTRKLGRPEGRGCDLNFFLMFRVIFDAIGAVPSSIIG